MVTLGDWGTVYQRLPGDTSFHALARLRSGHQFRCSPSPAALEPTSSRSTILDYCYYYYFRVCVRACVRA